MTTKIQASKENEHEQPASNNGKSGTIDEFALGDESSSSESTDAGVEQEGQESDAIQHIVLQKETSVEWGEKVVLGTKARHSLQMLFGPEHFYDETTLQALMRKRHEMLPVDLAMLHAEEEALGLISRDVAEKHRAIPIARVGNRLIVAIENPEEIFALDELKFTTGYHIDPIAAEKGSFDIAFERYFVEKSNTAYSGLTENEFDSENEESSFDDVIEVFYEDELDYKDCDEPVDLECPGEGPLIRLVNAILTEAVKKDASAIYIQLNRQESLVYFCIGGEVLEVMKPPLKLNGAILARIRVLAKLDLIEPKIPQDGRIQLVLRDETYTCLVSIMQTPTDACIAIQIVQSET